MLRLSHLVAIALGAAVIVALWSVLSGGSPDTAPPAASDSPPVRSEPAPADRPAQQAPARETQAPSGPRVGRRPGVPWLVREDQPHPPGTRIPMNVAKTDHGIRCPDGSYLPLLNGVESAPRIDRPEQAGPLPPVVATVVDQGGWDWYEHADGSMTTTRPQEVIDAAGNHLVTIVTLHNARAPDHLLIDLAGPGATQGPRAAGDPPAVVK